MTTLSRNDINSIVNKHIESIQEKVNPVAGDDIIVMKNGLIIVHKDSGIEYTVLGIGSSQNGDPVIVCSGPYGNINIEKSQFKDYERR